MWRLLLVALAACMPVIVPGAYLCGPEGTCPEGQACNGPDNVCVVPASAEPFSCEADADFEPDNSPGEAHLIPNLQCVSAQFENANCMMPGDTADWVKLVAPTVCTAVEVEARLTFPVAFEELGLELWDLDANAQIATDGLCTSGAEVGYERRCMDVTLAPGTSYGIKVGPTGNGACNGACNYNRYTLQVQLATP